MTLIQALQNAVAAVCPVVGVAIGDKTDKSTWRVDHADTATPAQKNAAAAAVAAFDPVTAVTPDLQAADYADAVDKVQFRLLFNLENRVRVLEGKAVITAAQYRQAVIDLWKQLNP